MADILRRLQAEDLTFTDDKVRRADYQRDLRAHKKDLNAYNEKLREHKAGVRKVPPRRPQKPSAPKLSGKLMVQFKFEQAWIRVELDAKAASALAENPVLLRRVKDRDIWLLNRELYITRDLRLTADDVRALVNEAENRRRIRLEKAHALQAMRDSVDDGRARRQPIPQEVKIEVWRRDGGRCVECGRNEDLEFDHIIPIALGGSNTVRNIQLLCEPCNRRKGASLG